MNSLFNLFSHLVEFILCLRVINLQANKFARTHCIESCPLLEKMMEVFDIMSPEELIESVGSCSGGDLA